MATIFEQQLESDIKDVFLNGDFSVEVIYQPDTIAKPIIVQYFQEALDKMDTLYNLVWCNFNDIPSVRENDIIEINGVRYGVTSFTPDEQKLGVNLFLNEMV